MLLAMRIALPFLLVLTASPAPAQTLAVPPVPVPAPAPALLPAPWSPTAPYVTPGQDEPGYRAWYGRALWRRPYVKAFHDYLATWEVAHVVPTWQLLRTASSWRKCGSEPFEVPPVGEWPHIVQTLRYVRDHVVPAVGPVESVSGYRNPILNVCAGGAPASAHKNYSAIDLVPLTPTTREALMRTLCAVHTREGGDYGVGLGFYAFLRFHVDTTKYRRWGSSAQSGCPPIIRPEDLASVPPQPPLEPALGAAAAAAAAAPPAELPAEPPAEPPPGTPQAPPSQ